MLDKVCIDQPNIAMDFHAETFWLDKVCIDHATLGRAEIALIYASTFWLDKVCIDQLNIADGQR